MEIKEPFIRVSAPSSHIQQSPRPLNGPNEIRGEELGRLPEVRIGKFLVKA